MLSLCKIIVLDSWSDYSLLCRMDRYRNKGYWLNTYYLILVNNWTMCFFLVNYNLVVVLFLWVHILIYCGHFGPFSFIERTLKIAYNFYMLNVLVYNMKTHKMKIFFHIFMNNYNGYMAELRIVHLQRTVVIFRQLFLEMTGKFYHEWHSIAPFFLKNVSIILFSCYLYSFPVNIIASSCICCIVLQTVFAPL